MARIFFFAFHLVLVLFVAVQAEAIGGDYEAHFTIQATDSNVVVDAIFPIPLDSAMLDYFPKLDTVTTEAGRQAGLKRFVNSNFQLIDRSKNRALKLLDVERLPGDSRGGDHYTFVFEQGLVTQMRNMFLFHLSGEQRNYNTYIEDGQQIEFITTPTSPVGTIDFTTSSTASELTGREDEGGNQWTLWIAAILVLLAVWMFLKRRNESERRNRRGR